MIKRIACILLTLLLVLTACSKENKPHISKTIFEELSRSYVDRDINDYRMAAAIANSHDEVIGMSFAYRLVQPENTVISSGEYLLSVFFARKAGFGIEDTYVDGAIAILENAVRDCDVLSAHEVFLCVCALNKYGREFDGEKAVESLEKRQNEVSGGFYDYIATGSGTQSCEIEASAYAYMTYVILRSKVNDLNLDNALIFLGNSIGDDNTLSDLSGKSSCATTALALTAMLASGIPGDGEISTALLTAINEFKSGRHYNNYKKNSDGAYADAFVILCASAALHGNPFTKAD